MTRDDPHLDASRRPVGGSRRRGPEPRAPVPSVDGRPGLDVEITNLARGQAIAVHVRGSWTQEQLEDRLLRIVAVRQPIDLRLTLEGSDAGAEPPLRRARAAIEAFGGALTVRSSPPDVGSSGTP